MSIVATTLSKALSATADTAVVASATGVSAPGPNKSNRTILWVAQEAMEVISLSSTTAKVARGALGTKAVAHIASSRLWAGLEADFTAFMESTSIRPRLGLALETITPTTAADTATITMDQLLGGLITATPTAAATFTLPTPALLIAALQAFMVQPWIGLSFEFTIKNTSAGANTITVATPTGGTTVGTMTIAQNAAKRLRIVVTAVDSPTYSVYTTVGSTTF